MKKILLTLSLVALFSVATKAQDPVKSKSTTTKKEVVNPDGTTSVVAEDKATTSSEPTKKEEPKKSGTRMAINEKGTSGTKATTNKKETKTETKDESTSPTGPTTKLH
ncbi:MAG: hypothetical protein JNJ41_08885 [Bacteroidia bacterium]|nr:hypothetical protein [Bacteroidia bacterium]